MALLVWLIVLLVKAIAAGAAAIVNATGYLVSAVAPIVGSYTHVVTDPVHHYLTSRAVVLDMSPQLLWASWLTIGVFLLLTLLAQTWIGRIGWGVFTAVTAAMVHAATVTTADDLAAGITVTAGIVIPVLVLLALDVIRGVLALLALPFQIAEDTGNTPAADASR